MGAPPAESMQGQESRASVHGKDPTGRRTDRECERGAGREGYRLLLLAASENDRCENPPEKSRESP